MTKSKEIESLHFGEAEIKPELKNESRLWDVYISQNQNGVLKSNCWSVVRHCYNSEAGFRLVRVYEGLNKDVAYRTNNSVYDNTRQLYVELGILPEDSQALWSDEKGKQDFYRRLREQTGAFRDKAGELIEQLDLELLVDSAQGTPMIPRKITEQKYGNPIQHWEMMR
ncbi:MAG: hypothetical protein ABIH82_02775 [Candidatus Woesearchaeota archaeon]